MFLEWHNRHTMCPVLIFCVSSNLLKDESRRWSACANEGLAGMVQNEGQDFQMKYKVARQMELCGTGVMDSQPAFSWCHVACPALTGGEGPAFGEERTLY